MYYKKSHNKNIFIGILLAVVAVFVAGLFVHASESNRGYRIVSVIEVSGRVSVVKDGIEYSAYPGMLLQEGHEVVTAANSYVRLALDDDKYVKLESGSKVVFETLGVLGSGKTKIILERGSLTSEIVKPLAADEEVVVNTPNAILAVRGTFFRVDLGVTQRGEITADVMTYGGQVATQRVLPDGETVQEEVLVDAGYKVSINMTAEDTYYVVETGTGEFTIVEPSDDKENWDLEEGPARPIVADDISDDDLVDIYFAAENGHEMFLTTEEIKTSLAEREIDTEEYLSVYQKAEAVKRQQEETGAQENVLIVTDGRIVADDSQPLIVKEETVGDNASDEASVLNNSTMGYIGLIDGIHEHSERRAVVEATCTTAGTIVVTCRDCEETISVTEVPALGHAYEEWTVTQEETCSTEGHREHTCGICGYWEDEVIEALGHDYASEFTIDVAATCVSAGSMSRHCLRCDAVSEVTEIPETGHEFGEWNLVLAADCETDGTRERSCENCEYAEEESLEALGHDYEDEFTIDVEATCIAEGSKSKHCSRCDSVSEITQIAMGGHSGGAWTVTVEATCSSTGSQTRYCQICAEPMQTMEIAVTGHSEIIEYVDGTETSDGLCRRYCEDCGTVYEEIQMLSIPKTFPDAAFASYIEATFDTDGHNSLSDAELSVLQSTTQLDLSQVSSTYGTISSLEGIQYFTSLTTLNCSNNTGLTSVDLSQNTNLTSLNISGCTSVTGLELTSLSSLQTLNCSGSGITSLDISSNSNLRSLTVANCTGLTGFTATSSTYAGALDFSGCTNMETLTLANSAGISGLTLTGCSGIRTLDVSGCLALSALDLAALTRLNTLKCYQTGISTLDINANTLLQYLDCSDTNIGTLDVSNNVYLEELYAKNTKLTTLNVSNRSSLWYDALRIVDVSGCTQLTSFQGWGSLTLYNVNLSGCTNLITVNLNGAPGGSTLQYVSIDGCSMLQTLVVSNSCIRDIDISGFSELTQFSAEYCTLLYTVVADNCTSLERVSFYGSYRLSSASLQNDTSLTTIDVDQCGMDQGTFEVNVTGTSLTTSDFSNWDSSYMQLINN